MMPAMPTAGFARFRELLLSAMVPNVALLVC